MKYFCKIAFATLLTIAVISCGDTKTKQTVSKLPTIDENTETEITVWAWNIAAKALMETAKTFNEKYPKIKVNVMELAGGLSAYERYSVIFSSGVGVPDVIQVESDYIQTFLDLKQYIDIEGKVDPSKISTSYDSEGKLVSIPWDSAPVVMFYREDLFNRAGIDAASIITWEDYIEAGKKLQSVFPNVKMNGFAYSKDDNFWRCLLVENNTYFLNKNGEITISSPKSIETLNMMKRLKDEGITLNTVNWDGQISASKNGTVATQIIGCWRAGTIKDQMPEMKGKWKIMPMPAFTKDGVRASSLGGSDLSVTASDPIKQAASVEFVRESLMNTDNQLMMYEKYSLFPSYLPAYDDERFNKSDYYFGDNFNQMLSSITREIPQAIYTSENYSEIRNIAISVLEDILNNNKDIKTSLEQAANQISVATGRKIAK